MMRVLGIDPGLTGAMALLCGDKELQVIAMPTEENQFGKGEQLCLSAIVDMIIAWRPTVAVMEIQHVIRGQGISSSGKTMRGFGELRGILAGMGIPVTFVRAVEWQKTMHKGHTHLKDTGERSIAAVRNIWPGISLRPNSRCRVDSHGMADAALIGKWLRLVRQA